MGDAAASGHERAELAESDRELGEVGDALHGERPHESLHPSVGSASIFEERVDRFLDHPPDVRREGDTLIVPIVEEVIVTRFKVVEEIAITLRRSVERRPQRVELRRERAVVERLASDEPQRKNRS